MQMFTDHECLQVPTYMTWVGHNLKIYVYVRVSWARLPAPLPPGKSAQQVTHMSIPRCMVILPRKWKMPNVNLSVPLHHNHFHGHQVTLIGVWTKFQALPFKEIYISLDAIPTAMTSSSSLIVYLRLLFRISGVKRATLHRAKSGEYTGWGTMLIPHCPISSVLVVVWGGYIIVQKKLPGSVSLLFPKQLAFFCADVSRPVNWATVAEYQSASIVSLARLNWIKRIPLWSKKRVSMTLSLTCWSKLSGGGGICFLSVTTAWTHLVCGSFVDTHVLRWESLTAFLTFHTVIYLHWNTSFCHAYDHLNLGQRTSPSILFWWFLFFHRTRQKI